MASLSINYLEVLALEPAVERWAHLWANKKVFIHCDNMTACALVNKGKRKKMLLKRCAAYSGSQLAINFV